jgi:hypothetical protein
MRRPLVALVAALLTAALTAALVARAGGAATTTSFRTPDAGAACRADGAALVCSSLGSPGSIRLGGGGATVVRALPWWDASTPVLHHWQHGRVACNLVGGAIVCTNGRTTIRLNGAGFAVAS